MSNMGKPARIRPPNSPTAPVRGLASGLLAFHKRNCYSEHGSVELSNSSYVNTRPEPAQNHFMCCMAGVSGTGEAGRELCDVNEPNPGCLVQGSVECRSRTGPPGYPLTAGAFLAPWSACTVAWDCFFSQKSWTWTHLNY